MQAMLSQLKILDFTALLPGPFATMLLADLGADVVKVESPTRPDMVRMDNTGHAYLNRSKRSIAIDLKKPGSADVVKQLVQTYDIVMEQFRPGVMDRLGVGYDALKAVKPDIIYCSITGYGQTGPYKDKGGHDINYMALSGLMSHMGRKDQGPLPLATQVADIGGGSLHSIVGVLAAVIHRQASGEGQKIDISMTDAAVTYNALSAPRALNAGAEPKTEGEMLNGGSFYDFYHTKDGRYMSVGSLEPKFFEELCKVLERADLIKLAYNQAPDKQAYLKESLQSEFAKKDFNQWRAIFENIDACVEPVLTIDEMRHHPQFQARQMVVEVPMEDGQTQPQLGTAIKASACEPVYRFGGAKLGAHSREVLVEAGFSDAEVTSLLEKKIIK